MKKTNATLSDEKHAASLWRRGAAVGLLAGGLLGAWTGGALGLLGAAGLAGAIWLLLQGQAGADKSSAHIPVNAVMAVQTGQRQGAEVMVAQVVPIWSRQVEVTRDAASDGLNGLLQTFAEISGALTSLSGSLASFSVSASPGAVDEAVRAESPALQALTAASSRAFAERDAAVAELGRCVEGLSELQHLAKQSRELARHTRLVAFNASIESNRQTGGASSVANSQAGAAPGSNQQGGSQAVATELRMLAGRIGETAEKIERVVNAMTGAVRKARRVGEVGDTSPEELRLEIDLSARRALDAMLGTLGTSMQSSGEVRQAAENLAAQLEATFMHFQFGDRISQMLSIVANDMSNFAQWVAANPRATQSDAADWLTALEASYTMEEQRSTHHGNVHVEQSAAVEFF
jgi:methyl-accepting chemotaxis protein